MRIPEPNEPHLSGHYFVDWTHGIDHPRCAYCGLYRHAFDKNPQECKVRSQIGQDALSTGGVIQHDVEDFGDTWAIRPELTPDEIYCERPCPDVKRFPSRDKLFEWLDEPRDVIDENGAAMNPKCEVARYCFWPPYCPWPLETRRKQRWYGRVAVRTLVQFEGPPFAGLTFHEFLVQQGIEDWPDFDISTMIERSLGGRDPRVSCCLDSDWDFSAIEQDTAWMPGHEFAGCRIRSFGDQIAKVLTDLQLAIRRRHPSLPAAAEACFLESWEVLRHVAEFCGKILAPSDAASELLRETRLDTSWSSRYIESARYAVRIQLAVYAAAIRSGIDLNTGSAATDLNRVSPLRDIYLSELVEKLLLRVNSETQKIPTEKALLTLGLLPVVGLGSTQVCVSRLHAKESAILSECDQLNTGGEEKVLLIMPPGAALSPEARSLLETRGFILGPLMPAGSDGSVTLLWNTVSVAGSFARPHSPENACVCRKEGQIWTLTFGGKTVGFDDLLGFTYLSTLLANPGREFHVSDLRMALLPTGEKRVSDFSDTAIDATALSNYRREVGKLKAELASFGPGGPGARRARIQERILFLESEIRRATTFGGKLRKVNPEVEAHRKAVSIAVGRCLQKIQEVHPKLWRHLNQSIHRGHYCSYTPSEKTEWST
jgi:hypothetical protein